MHSIMNIVSRQYLIVEGIRLKKIVVALGGNALQDGNEGATADAQLRVVRNSRIFGRYSGRRTCLTITHGNGPR